jgi:UDP-N-acetylglucosamine 2-epimerase (non-hydrolysing)
MKHCIVLGTRPEVIKMSSTIRALKHGGHDYILVHTNQHYSEQMDSIFFQELDLPQPDIHLHIGSGSHGAQTGKMLEALERVFQDHSPDVVYVQGDTNTVLAGALAASKLNIPVAHVEAGLRSFDRTMPEETNRILTDHMSSVLFAPTAAASQLLQQEGISSSSIHIVGNPIVDAVLQNVGRTTEATKALQQQIGDQRFCLVTLHRPANVDSKEVFFELLEALHAVATQRNCVMVFPMHPRTKKQMSAFSISLPSSFLELPPVSFLELLWLEKNSELIFTDSGGIQEEACILQKKCLTLRPNTERPETIEVGGNILAGTTKSEILAATATMSERVVTWSNPFGDGTTGQQMVQICEQLFRAS